ncbi:MAG: repeat-associated core domain protein [Gemmataceae bacterium]|nr:repeat-associated core domain protein [Gemmataceae bacterium]
MRHLVLVLAAGFTAALPQAITGPPCECPPAHRDVVERWNEAALDAVRADKTPPPLAARNLALLHIAIYDAVNAIDRTHRPFLSARVAPPGASAEVAAAVAAHRVLFALYPDRLDQFDTELDESLYPLPDGPGKTGGLALGQAVAEDVLHWRAGDRADARRETYTPRLEVGRWRPTPPGYRPPLLPGWGSVRCLTFTDPVVFRPPGPPALGSDDYTAAYREVKVIGATDSRARSPEQTEIARFWADGDGTVTPPGHWNRIARGVAADRGTTPAETARLLALLNVALADAGIVCWESKFRYDVWRPVTAIRAEDPGWTPLLPTPPFPAYPSGHSSFSGAAAASLAAFFGTDQLRFTSTSDGLPGVTRRFDSFTTAAEEAGMSRIYGGIHWAFDNRDGLACGRKVGENVAAHHFRPVGAGVEPGFKVDFAVRHRDR